MDARQLKIEAARAALAHVTDGMRLGIGTGSTAEEFVRLLAEKVATGMTVIGVPTSERTAALCSELGVPLTTLDETPELDLTIDGADEIDPELTLIKGGGGALLREKMVEVCAKTFVVIVDESKLCDALGPSFPLPVEITPFCHEHTLRKVAALPSLEGCEAKLRMGAVSTGSKVDGDAIAVTDNGNYIVDLFFKAPIKDAAKAGEELKATVGVVDHGLFCGMASCCIVAGKDGVSLKTAQ